MLVRLALHRDDACDLADRPLEVVVHDDVLSQAPAELELATAQLEPPIEGLLEQVDSKFTLVTLSARRGRQINSYFNQLGEGLGSIVPPQVTSISRKPLSIALEEIYAGKVKAVRLEDLVDGEPVEGAAAEDGETAPDAAE